MSIRGISASLKTLGLISFSLLILIGCQPSDPMDSQHQTLRVSSGTDPKTLDPRQLRDLETVTSIHMLYEGLMRVGQDGQPAPAIAETVTLSPDQKTYTFKLRSSAWTNGEAVTAHDFEQTWKSNLDPQFPCPNAYQFYGIQGAKAAKEGKGSIDEVGVKALDDTTLVVQLDQPTPNFPLLTAAFFFYPVHASLRHQAIDSNTLSDADLVTNGPFKLEKWKRNNELTAIPNPYYWNKDAILLPRIALVKVDNSTALQLFQNGDLEWAGSPMSLLSPDSLAYLKSQNLLQAMPAAGVYLFRFNTEQPPFNHPKIRQAFTYALNRSELVEHVLQGNQTPAIRFVPPSFLPSNPHFKDNDKELARHLFQEALDEQKISLQDLPSLSLCYSSAEEKQKIAQVAQQQWKDVLGVNVDLQACEGKVFYQRLKSHDYQIGMGSLYADFRDPLSFLEVFKQKDNGPNNTQWENPDFIRLLDDSALALDINKRNELLMQAEEVIMQDMPIAPLFFATYNYVKDPSIKGVYFSELGYLDFKNAYWDSSH